MQYEAFEFRREGHVARVTWNQPARGNPIDETFCREIKLIAIECDEDPDIRAVLMDANGRHFSVGGDVKAFTRDRAALPRLSKAMTADLNAGVIRLARMDAPVIVALHSLVTGGAVAFAAAADFALASSDARFYAAFTAIGFSCDCGTSYFLPRRVGPRRALEFLLKNETWSADEALAAGLVNEVLPDLATLHAAGSELAQRLAAGPTRSYGEIRRLFHTTYTQTLEAQLEDEARALSRCTHTDDAWQALNAVLAKRDMRFHGR
jgi:2-(1,2-epoxy-1,2-dihydrophenyl)acetyl-CoA isomerase